MVYDSSTPVHRTSTRFEMYWVGFARRSLATRAAPGRTMGLGRPARRKRFGFPSTWM